MVYRRKGVDLAEMHYRLNPVSNKSKQDYAYALSGVAGLQAKTGQLGSAMESLQQALVLQTELVEEDTGNLKKRWNLLRKAASQAKYLELSGKLNESWSMSLALESRMRELLELDQDQDQDPNQDQDQRIDNTIDFGAFLRDFSYRAYRKREFSMASRLLTESIQILAAIAQQHPDNREGLYELALAYFFYWNQNNATLPDDAAAAWLTVFKDSSNLRSCSEMDIASRQALIAEEHDKARDLVSHLIDRGYHEPGFKRFCFEHGLCLAESKKQILQ